MKKWHRWFIITLSIVPVLILLGVGVWALWQTGHLLWSWWILPICWGAAYLLSRRWKAELFPLESARPRAPRHWSPRDEDALQIVSQHQQRVHEISQTSLIDPHYYLNVAQDLAFEIARHYHPKAKNPVGSLTVPELLAAARLATEDLEEWVRGTVPGSHLLTIDQWRILSRTPEWYRTVRDLSWAAAILVNPLNAARFVTSKVALDPLTNQLQANLLAAFYMMFVRNVGFYLIELNSGRLGGGAERYRATMQSLERGVSATTAPPVTPTLEPVEVTIAVVGQVKAGKSSLINCLLGAQEAKTDVLPETQSVTRYRLKLGEIGGQLIILDTPGFGEAGAPTKVLAEIQIAMRSADLALYVMNATNSAREPDRRLLQNVNDWFAAHRDTKPPPLLGVLTHIDLLSPASEWSPPYDWQTPGGPKAQSIHDAVDYVAEELGEFVGGVVPVCSDAARERDYGVDEWLVPAMTVLLDDAHACALLRRLKRETDRTRVVTLVRQFQKAGLELLTYWTRDS